MATWKSENVVITDKGNEVLSKVQIGSGSLTVSRIVTGNTIIPYSQLHSVTEIPGIKQECDILSVSTDMNGSEISMSISNEHLEESYPLYTIGIYVTHPDYSGEVLYLVAECDTDKPDIIPLPSVTVATMYYSVYMAHSNTDNVTITINKSNSVTLDMIGSPNGVASLGVDSKIPEEQIPSLPYVSNEDRGVKNGIATLDSGAKIPSNQIPNLNYVKSSEKGSPNGVATLNAKGKMPENQIPDIFIKSSEKGAPNGVPTLDENGTIPSASLPPMFTPRILVNVPTDSVVTCTNGETVLTKTSVNNTCEFGVPNFGSWTLNAKLGGQVSNTEVVEVSAVQQYTATLTYFTATIIVTAKSGAKVLVSGGGTSYEKISKGTATFTVSKSGTYLIHAEYDGCSSNTVQVSATNKGQTYQASVSFITLTVTADSGSSLTVSKGDVTKHDISGGEGSVFYLPSTGVWTVTANLSGQSASENVNCSSYTNYNVKLDYYKYYGVRIQINNDSTAGACTYIEDAVGQTPGLAGWKDTKLFKSVRPCMVKNGVVQYYLNPNNLSQKATGGSADISSGNDGDAMLEIPKIGYKFSSDGSYRYIYVTDDPNAPGYCYRAHSRVSEGDCDKIYIGLFLANESGGSLHSLSGKSPVTDITLTNARNKASARGTGFELLSFYPLTLLQCLYMIRYKDRYSQKALGRGYVDGNSGKHNTGGTISKGIDFGETSGKQQMCFLNIEDFWGNLYQWIDGLYSDGSRNIKTTFKNFNDNGSGYPYNHPSGLGSNTGGWISDIQGTNDSGFIVKATSGSTTTHYTDYGYLYAGCVAFFGGSWSNGDDAGAFLLFVNSAPSLSGSHLGARLVYKHIA